MACIFILHRTLVWGPSTKPCGITDGTVRARDISGPQIGRFETLVHSSINLGSYGARSASLWSFESLSNCLAKQA